MLRRGELLEADLNRALEHVRESNKHLKEFVRLLETVDGHRWNETGRIGSWMEIAERPRFTNAIYGGGSPGRPHDRFQLHVAKKDAPNRADKEKGNPVAESD